MTHLLDTNPCVHVLRQNGNPLVKARVAAAMPTGALVLCSVVVAELYYGAEKSNDPAAERAKVDAFIAQFLILPFDTPEAVEYAHIRADLERRGLPIGWNDYQVAAIARTNRLKLVTHDTAEFSRVPGLDVVDWELP